MTRKHGTCARLDGAESRSARKSHRHIAKIDMSEDVACLATEQHVVLVTARGAAKSKRAFFVAAQ